MSRAITAITVIYEDGSTDTWHGRGTVSQTRTPDTARKAPVLRDDDISYVEARIVFDRVEGDATPLVAEGEGR